MKTRLTTKFKANLYTSFAGLNTSRSDISMERAEAQPFTEMDNLYCSSKGFLTNEAPIDRVLPDERQFVSHFKFLNADTGVGLYATRTDGGTSLRALGKPQKLDNVWPKAASITTTLFNSKVIVAGGQKTLRSYDGAEFKEITSDSIEGGRYVVQVQNRLAVAGFDKNPNEINISRVNNENLYFVDEPADSASVLRGFRFNVQNLIGNGDRIRGISPYEANKFAIFTSDRVLVYLADPDLTLWTIDTRVVVRYGTVSHKSIVSVGDELYFCSRAGVHSLRRSSLNGTTVFTLPMSDDIQELYQTLLAQVGNTEDISAYFNPDEGRLHIFFPVNQLISYRLTAALTPAMAEDQVAKVRWSLTTFAGTTCGDNIAGRTVYGSISGLYKVNQWFTNIGTRGPGFAQTPILWHKDFFNPKQGYMLVMYASGVGRIRVVAEDETFRQLGEYLFELPDEDQIDYAGVPLQRQFLRPFPHTYIGVRLKIFLESDKMIRVFGVGVLTQEM